MVTWYDEDGLVHMTAYKLMRIDEAKQLHAMYVFANKVYPIGEWIEAEIGPDGKDDKHVKSKLGNLSKRPGLHCTLVPWTDWIGTIVDDVRCRRRENVWVEVEIKGKLVAPSGTKLPDGFYFFRTNSKQKDPWIICRWMKINRILPESEVDARCRAAGLEPQKIA